MTREEIKKEYNIAKANYHFYIVVKDNEKERKKAFKEFKYWEKKYDEILKKS